MTREQLIELVQRKLEGGNLHPDLKGKYHPEVVAKCVGLAYNQLINDTYESSDRSILSLDPYTVTYKDVAITCDEDTDTWYSLFPASVLMLPDKQVGLRLVAPMSDNTSTVFAPAEKNSWDVFANLEVGLVDPSIGYSVKPDRVEYAEKPIDIDTVRMELIPSFDAYEDTDEVKLPFGKDIMIFQLVVQILTDEKAEHQSNDNSDKQV